MNQPTYNFDDFVADCTKATVFITKNAALTARSDFNLNTQKNTLHFISNGGLEKPSFINSRIWENNPNPEKIIMVDAWEFFSGYIYGYIAFFHQPLTNKWIIKSFKKNTNPDPRNLAIKEQFEKLGYLH